jgi:peptidoglycan-N-acetylglucosamine deacetylase
MLRDLVPHPVRAWAYDWGPARERRWRGCAGVARVAAGGHAVLTLDDGPDPDATPAVLDALDGAGARATFFVVGEHVRRHPELAREPVCRGNEIAVHGFTHRRQDRIPADESRADVLDGLAEVERVSRARPRWYRPPYGKLSGAAARACSEQEMEPVRWSAWGLDWEPLPAWRIAATVCRDLDDGAIVLLHDAARYGPRASAAPTAAAIPRIATCARARGLRLVTLGEAVVA